MTAESVSYLLGQQEVGLRQHSKWTLWTGHNIDITPWIIFPRFLYRFWLPSHSVSLFVVTLLSPRWMCRLPFKNSTSEPILDGCHLQWWKNLDFILDMEWCELSHFSKLISGIKILKDFDSIPLLRLCETGQRRYEGHFSPMGSTILALGERRYVDDDDDDDNDEDEDEYGVNIFLQW